MCEQYLKSPSVVEFTCGIISLYKEPFSMDINNRHARKSYALHRMSLAIDRAMRATSSAEKNAARRWAAAWGLIAGIRSSHVRLRDTQMVNSN